MVILAHLTDCAQLGSRLSGACFILPAALAVTALAWAYDSLGQLPLVEGVLYGVKSIIMAVLV